MNLPPGFKTEAERISLAMREELRLESVDRLDPWDLAAHRGVEVMTLSEYGRMTKCETATRELLTSARSDFSAMTLVVDSTRFIVHNESHARTRQASNLAHELAHDLLGHPPSEGIGDGGCRRFDDDVEAEADWLGGTLLVPRSGSLKLVRRGMTVGEIAEHFGVSEKMCEYRLGVTGVLLQVKRAASLAARRRT